MLLFSSLKKKQLKFLDILLVIICAKIVFKSNLQISKVTKESDGTLTLETNSGVIDKVNCLLWAIGRVPNSDTIGLENIVSEPSTIGYKNNTREKI